MFRSGYIAFLGAPNAGKSTLLNAILKEKLAIVTAKPQTTRKKFLGIHSEEGVQMIFLDTPGIHSSERKLNQSMLAQVEEAIEDADILCYLIALDEPVSAEFKEAYGRACQKYPKKKSVMVFNKADLPENRKKVDAKRIIATLPGVPTFSISALNGEGVGELVEKLKELLPEGPAYFPDDQLTDVNLRDLAAELIREKVMECMHQEIPYAAAVEITAFKEEGETTRIEADIVVEQDSQKGMVIGAGGKMIKEIGSLARAELIKLVGTKVFLGLQVKVDKNWTKSPAKMAKYGYTLPH